MRPKRPLHLSKRELDRLVEEATVDCYDESEQVAGLYTMIEENLAVPFETEVLGVVAIVERIDLTDRDEIVAVCRRGRERQRIGLVDLPLPSPQPAGAQWIAAYRHWAHESRGTDREYDDSRPAQVLSDDPPPRATPASHESNLAGLLHLREHLLNELVAGRRQQRRHVG